MVSNKINTNYELSDEQQHVIDHIKKKINNQDKKSFKSIVLGAAGTGKSFLIEYMTKIITDNNKICLVCAHQGIAATNINGVTIYKLFSFFDRKKGCVQINNTKYYFEKENYNKTTQVYKKIRKIRNCYGDIKKTFSQNPLDTWLIIDEVSMISLEVIDDIDILLKAAYNSKEIFGNVNVIFLGDYNQLKPVKETPMYNIGTKDHFIKYFTLFELTINQRQKDKEFFELCQDIKKGILTSKQKKLLKSRLIDNIGDKKIIKDMIHIYPLKQKCELHNISKLKKINSDIYIIKADDIYLDNMCKTALSKDEKSYFNGLYNFLVLAIGAKIMITANDSSSKYCNGTIGTITNIVLTDEYKKQYESVTHQGRKAVYPTEKNNTPTITQAEGDTQINTSLHSSSNKNIFELLTPDEQIELKKIEHVFQKKNIHKYGANNCIITIQINNTSEEFNLGIITRSIEQTYEVLDKNNKVVTSKKTVFTRTMYPLQLAWAITTHKIQGVTLDEAVIDLGEENFDPVQLYINISRVKTLNNVYITSLSLPLKKSSDRKIISAFIKTIKDNNEKSLEYKEKKEIYNYYDDDDDDDNDSNN